MRKTIIEGKNIEEIKNKAVEYFNEPLDKMTIEIKSEKRGFLGLGTSVTALVSLNINPMTEGLNYLKTMLDMMNIEAKVEMITNKKEVKYNIYSDNNSLLIGKGGRTLDAIQYITRCILASYSDERILCMVDVGEYKQKRKTQLEILATKMAREVARTKVPIRLDPMNSYERRIVHTKLSEWRDVYTESVGDEPNRCLVIKSRKKTYN